MDQASHAVRLVDRGQFKSIRQVSRPTGVAGSTVQDRRVGRQPRGQEEIKHARLTRYQEEILAKYAKSQILHPGDGVAVVANVRNGYTKYVADKVGWPVNWWPTLFKAKFVPYSLLRIPQHF